MPDYNKANIYKLCCKDIKIKEIYVGSTCNFTRRKCQHKSLCNNEKNKAYNFNVYRFIREHGNWKNWDMILLEEVSCENKKQLHKIEREYIEKLGATLNKQIPSRTQKEYQKEWREKNREWREKYIKEYREYNREKFREYRKQIITCICGRDINFANKSRHYRTKKHRIRISEIKKPLHEELLKNKI